MCDVCRKLGGGRQRSALVPQGNRRVGIAGVDSLLLRPMVEIEVLAWALTEVEVEVDDRTEVFVGV